MPDLEALFTFIIVYVVYVWHACYSMYVEVRTTLGVSSLPLLLCGFQGLTWGTWVARLVQQVLLPLPHTPDTLLPSPPPILLLFYFYYIYFFILCCFLPWTGVEIRRELERESVLSLSLCWSGGLNSGHRTLYRTGWSWTQKKTTCFTFPNAGVIGVWCHKQLCFVFHRNIF